MMCLLTLWGAAACDDSDGAVTQPEVTSTDTEVTAAPEETAPPATEGESVTSAPTETETTAHVCEGGEWTVKLAASCTEQGIRVKTCACGETVEEDVIPATGPTVAAIPARDPTCSETGMSEG